MIPLIYRYFEVMPVVNSVNQLSNNKLQFGAAVAIRLKKHDPMNMWTTYFSTTASIASSLTGLIFVGLSINVKKIFCITKTHLPSRAFGSLILLTNIVVISNLCLVPGQPLAILGSEILLMGIAIWIIVTWLDFVGYKTVEEYYKKQYFRSLFYSQLSLLPVLAAGLFFIFNYNNAFYILLPGIIFSLIKSLFDIWFLMVDINR